MASALRKGRSRVRIPVGAGGFLFSKMSRIVLEAIKFVRVVSEGGGVIQTEREVHLHILPRLRMNGAMRLLPTYAFMT